MRVDEIIAFITICQTQSLSAAAEKLYLSQPTVSNRIKSLEQELGVTLIVRHKGVRNIELTEYGERFLPIAHQWMQLQGDIINLRNNDTRNEISIVCPETLSECFMAPLLGDIINNNPPIHIKLRTCYSQDVVHAVSNNRADIGLGFYLHNFNNVTSTPLFDESVLLLRCKSPDAAPLLSGMIHPSQLDRRNEILMDWSPTIQQWHDSLWDANIRPFAEVDSCMQVPLLMRRPGLWMVIPYCVSNMLRRYSHLEILRFDCATPKRTCYLFTNRYPNPYSLGTINSFKQLVIDFCEKRTLDWNI